LARKPPANATILIPVKLPIIKRPQHLEDVLVRSLARMKLTLETGDVLAVASKVVSIAEGAVVDLARLEMTNQVVRIARRWHLRPQLAALVLQEADAIVGGVRGFLLTSKNGMMTANAGVDLKNTPKGMAVRWPANPDKTAATLRRTLEAKFRARLGVIIVDSRVTPMRLGTVGLAIGSSGVVAVRDYRGVQDLFGRKIRVTQSAVLDDLASCAHLLMGEAGERIGAVVIARAPIALAKGGDSRFARLDMDRCLITSNLHAASAEGQLRG
jgi:coenzyme F420-0:L-glutamate ligase